jgi:hypothetical protein
MAVTINEFEVVTEPAAPVQASAAGAAVTERRETLSPEEFVALIRRESERRARVWAH